MVYRVIYSLIPDISWMCFFFVDCSGRRYIYYIEPVSNQVDRAFAIVAVDSGSIPGRVKPKTTKIGIHSFSA